jgi:RNA polymerase sigma-70 factor (ECF subfamily)
MLDVSLSTEGVWSELHANIRGFVGRRVRQPADVDDIVQRVFLQVHRALPTLRDADRLHAWLYQTTRRAIADYYRAPSHREIPAGSAVDLAPHVVDESAHGDDEDAMRELGACLKPLISSLKTADQEALQLVELEGLTQVEAASKLGLSVSGMKSRVQRARLHLRTALDECCRVALDRRGGVISYEARTDQCGSCAPADPALGPARTDLTSGSGPGQDSPSSSDETN